LVKGITSTGSKAILAGVLPTPAIAYLTKKYNAKAGIVISASHNPADHNGIKIFSKDGFKLPDETEHKIENLILDNNENTEQTNADTNTNTETLLDAQEQYIVFLEKATNIELNNIKIVLDCANGAACNVAPALLKKLGAEVTTLNNTPNGKNINLNCGAMHPNIAQQAVKEHNADIGISLDGDADRVIVCDENGNEVDGDHIIAIAAIYLKENSKLSNNTVVATVMANKGFDIAMEKNNIQTTKTKVGDRYVIEEMRKNNYSLGGEQSGHIIFLDHVTTGDGLLTALQLLKIMKEKDKKISELAQCMHSLPQILINIRVKEKPDFGTLPEVTAKVKETEDTLGNQGRVLLRYSGTENLARVMVEGPNQDEIKTMADEIANLIKNKIGAEKSKISGTSQKF
ncbi:phosphoglucosamine mutase, partial [Nanoarchaeota archaeon]